MASYFVVYALCPKDILWVISTFSQTVTVWVPWVPWVPWSKQRVPAKNLTPMALMALLSHTCWGRCHFQDISVDSLSLQIFQSPFWQLKCHQLIMFLTLWLCQTVRYWSHGMPWPIANSDRTERWWFSVAFWIYQRVSMFPQSLQFSIPRRPWVGLLAVVWLSPWLQWNAQQPATPGAAIHQTWWFSMIFP